MIESSHNVSSKQRLIDATVELLSRQGYSGTGVNEIARVGQAPMGSFYHHFPAGKEALAAEALRAGGAQYAALIARALARPGTLGDRLAAIATLTAKHLQRTAYAQGCPVATTALETVANSEVLQAEAANAFAMWQSQIDQAAQSDGWPPSEAEALAVAALALIEGAEMLARVRRSPAPLATAAQALRALAAQPFGPAAPQRT